MAKRPKQPAKSETPSLFDYDAATPLEVIPPDDQPIPKFDIEKAHHPGRLPGVVGVGHRRGVRQAVLHRVAEVRGGRTEAAPDPAGRGGRDERLPLHPAGTGAGGDFGARPVPDTGARHGLCFSVRRGVALPASLRNIYRELQTNLGIPPAKHGYLEAWARQGVFLLNTVLTVRAGSPNSHKGKGWEEFTDAALKAVNKLDRKVVFLLWGAHAKQKAKLIDQKRHAVITGVHPSPMSADNGFFGSKPFSKVNEALEDAGLPPIDWKLPEV